MRSPLRRPLVALAVLGLGLAGCSGPEQPDTVAAEFADALRRDDVAAAARLTTDPAAATPVLEGLYRALGTENEVAVRSADGGDFTLDVTWKLGPGGRNLWQYTTSGLATDTDAGWRVKWSPATVAPGLDAGPLEYSPAYGDPARVLDAAGGELMTEQVVTLVNLAPDADTAGVAALVAPVAPGLTAQTLDTELAAAQGRTVTAITLRDADIAPIQNRLSALRGVTLAPQPRLLTVDRALAGPPLAGLAELWQQEADAAAGWWVRAETPQGDRRVAGRDPRATADIASTLEPELHRAAEAALAPIPTPAAVVALRPSTGAVVAVAQNAAADAQGALALTGLYPPGSTFKTVTAAAALQAGAATPDTVLPCPGRADIEGRRIPNDDDFDLGRVPLHTAFARSCNTTMAALAVGLPPTALTDAAAQLGLGIDYVTPGLTTVTGSVPAAETPAQRVEASIGQGQVTASPFGMALVGAALAQGSVPAPAVVQGRPGTPDRIPPALPAGIADDVRSMMRETVTGGTATALRDIPGLLGKTGTAEYGDGTAAHGWFLGIDGDLAFAVFVADAGSSEPAVAGAGRMLRATR
ncbi:penicillin-binding transpeptidase domain-containing protein [Nocardia sp. NPDC057353]|uniref:penicillin-binding transpeptidase domain-containing protein n=1 Tax=Nocardia sp. NPDC057353 TaxID=3346104 RepID=UPI0036351325